MKIAYIATSAIPSSTANSIQVMKVCQALTLNGHEPHLFVPSQGEIHWDTIKVQYGLQTEFPIHPLASRKNFKRFDFIFRALQQSQSLKVEVIYTRMLWTAVIAQFVKFPVILELHDIPAGRFGEVLFKRYLASKTKKFTVLITRALKIKLESVFSVRIPDDECCIAPDGVDLERYQGLPEPEQARKRLGIKENLTAVYTGGFYKGRGLELLLELAKNNPSVQFLWVGGKPEAVEAWNAIIHNLNVQNITLTGFVSNDTLPLYQAAGEILLMPFGKKVAGSSGGNTADICSPLKMFEYMAADRAILSSDLPVLHEVLNSTNALFYELENFEDLNKKLNILINDPAMRISMAKKAKSDVAQYNWQKRMQLVIAKFN